MNRKTWIYQSRYENDETPWILYVMLQTTNYMNSQSEYESMKCTTPQARPISVDV